MLFLSMLAGAAIVSATGNKLKLEKGAAGKDCADTGDLAEEDGGALKGIAAPDTFTTECIEFPSAWIGVVGSSDTYKAYKLICSWTKAEKDPVLWNSELFTDADCKTKSSDTMFSADYKSGTCEVQNNMPLVFTMGDHTNTACMGITTDGPTASPSEGPKESAAAGVTGLAGLAVAAVAAAL